MGGGDLNQKKSWHPHTMKNQERVWKAEQADAVEKRRMLELQKEIQEERGREELTKFGQETGVLTAVEGQGGRKLDWMYNKPGNAVNREEYLLGRTVDRAFEQMTAEEKQAAAGNSANVPKNHVEHECIPTSIRSYMDAPSEQVDMQRKLHEDPLVAIRKREMESRQQLLQNPVKLKELHRILKEEENQRNVSKKLKKIKKHKKKNKKHKSKKHDDEDLDKMLAEKYNQLKTTLDTGEEMDIKSLITLKYSRLTEQLGKDKKSKKRESDSEEKSSKRRKTEKKSKSNKYKYRNSSPENSASKTRERHSTNDEKSNKHKKESSSDRKEKNLSKKQRKHDDDSDSQSDVERSRRSTEKSVAVGKDSRNSHHKKSKGGRNHSDSEEERPKHRKESSSIKNIDSNEFDIKTRREMSEERKIKKGSRNYSTSSERNGSQGRRTSRSPDRKRSSRDDRHRSNHTRKSSRSPEKIRKCKNDNEVTDNRGKERSVEHKSSINDIASSKKNNTKRRSSSTSDSSDSSDDNDDRKNYGLVSADGKRIKTNSNVKVEFKTNRREVKKPWVKTERKRLTEAEIEEKRKEMMENATWREKERDKNIKKYQEEDRKLTEKDSGTFDPDFLKKQLSRAANIGTVEGRIKANINNIQRSGKAMDYNFAKRS